ncbi:MAG: error-prone DNA polymerase, partial [Pirellulales bacterium]|nr:error-prone DNA polymerase [Pirellulales bacterium]
MPDPVPSSRRPLPVPPRRPLPAKAGPAAELSSPSGPGGTPSPAGTARSPQARVPPYAELHCKSNFSFLRGASHPDELAAQAAHLGYTALAITDRHSLAGVVRAHAAAKAVGLKLLVGAEVWPQDGPGMVLLAADRASYGRLARLLTTGKRRAAKGECSLFWEDVAAHAERLLAGVLLPPLVQAAADGPSQVQALARVREVFGERAYALAELHRGSDDRQSLARQAELARRGRLPLAAANDVLYHVPQRQDLQDVLTAVRHHTTVARAGALLLPNAERHLRPREELAWLFAAVPGALARSVELATRAAFSLDELRYEYPEELSPPGVTPLEYLRRLAWEGARRRYPQGVPERVCRLLEHELALIAELRYEAYFLTVWDLVRFARSRGILCQGRGSAANSAVCYCLGVTSVDPDRMDLLFERFVSRERREAPDIDIDFEHERREEVLQYLYEKYGRDRAGLTAEVITYRPRSAVRDVGKALGLAAARLDELAKSLDGFPQELRLSERAAQAGMRPDEPAVAHLLRLAGELVGFPRHLSQHVGGMVITRGPLSELVPIENAAMPGRTVIEWDKDDLDELGILKVDCLALGMLTCIRKCLKLVETHHGRRLTLATIPPEDPAVYEMISRADTLGVFQIESRAQMSMLPRLKPQSFYDLVIEVAIVRPGPIQGNMVHPYLRRRNGLEPVTYPNQAIRRVLEKTLGVPLFQEQAMRLAMVAAGFTAGEADQLRRAMGGWRRPGLIEQFRHKLISGMLARGLPQQFAEQVFQQIRGFGEYGFPESHAASFALLVYASAWLKCYYPAAFAAALLNSQPMGFYAPAQIVRDAREHGVCVLPADVNHSQWDCTLEPPAEGAETDASCSVREAVAAAGTAGESKGGSAEACPSVRGATATEIVRKAVDSACPSVHGAAGQSVRQPALRLGLRYIAGLPRAAAERLLAARGAGPFASVHDLARRAKLSRAVLVRLAQADALGSLARSRRH